MTRDEIATELRSMVVGQQCRSVGGIRTPPDQITDASTFEALGFDSLDNIGFIMDVEERFDLEDMPDADSEGLLTGQAVDYLAGKLSVAA